MRYVAWTVLLSTFLTAPAMAKSGLAGTTDYLSSAVELGLDLGGCQDHGGPNFEGYHDGARFAVNLLGSEAFLSLRTDPPPSKERCDQLLQVYEDGFADSAAQSMLTDSVEILEDAYTRGETLIAYAIWPTDPTLPPGLPEDYSLDNRLITSGVCNALDEVLPRSTVQYHMDFEHMADDVARDAYDTVKAWWFYRSYLMNPPSPFPLPGSPVYNAATFAQEIVSPCTLNSQPKEIYRMLLQKRPTAANCIAVARMVESEPVELSVQAPGEVDRTPVTLDDLDAIIAAHETMADVVDDEYLDTTLFGSFEVVDEDDIHPAFIALGGIEWQVQQAALLRAVLDRFGSAKHAFFNDCAAIDEPDVRQTVARMEALFEGLTAVGCISVKI